MHCKMALVEHKWLCGEMRVRKCKWHKQHKWQGIQRALAGHWQVTGRALAGRWQGTGREPAGRAQGTAMALAVQWQGPGRLVLPSVIFRDLSVIYSDFA